MEYSIEKAFSICPASRANGGAIYEVVSGAYAQRLFHSIPGGGKSRRSALKSLKRESLCFR